jgi:hypothetical protein
MLHDCAGDATITGEGYKMAIDLIPGMIDLYEASVQIIRFVARFG